MQKIYPTTSTPGKRLNYEDFAELHYHVTAHALGMIDQNFKTSAPIEKYVRTVMSAPFCFQWVPPVFVNQSLLHCTEGGLWAQNLVREIAYSRYTTGTCTRNNSMIR